MFFHFNNACPEKAPRLKPLNELALESSSSSEEADDDEEIIPALRRLLEKPFNREYLSRAYAEWLDDADDDDVIVRDDFNRVCLYLILFGEMNLTVATVSAYITNQFNPLDHVFNTLSDVERAREACGNVDSGTSCRPRPSSPEGRHSR